MKRILLAIVIITFVGCAPKASFESRVILELCNDSVADSCIIQLPGDTTSTHYVKAAFGNNGIYYISDLPLSDPRMRIWIDNGLRTRHFCDFEYVGQQDSVYIYSLAYSNFPSLSRYEYDLIRDCELYYYNGEKTFFEWCCTWYPESELTPYEESFEKWFAKAIPYMLR